MATAARTLNMVPVGPNTYGYRPPAFLPKAKAAVKGAGRAIGRKAIEHKYELAVIGGAVGLALVDRFKLPIPSLPFIGRAGTIALSLYLVGRFGNMPRVKAAALFFAGLAVYELITTGKIA